MNYSIRFISPHRIPRCSVNQGKKPVDFIFVPGGLMPLNFKQFDIQNICNAEKLPV